MAKMLTHSFLRKAMKKFTPSWATWLKRRVVRAKR